MPKIYENAEELKKDLTDVLEISENDVKIINAEKLKNSVIDNLIFSAVFGPEEEVKNIANQIIRKVGTTLGIYSASIQSLYEAMGRREILNFTVPAINIRALTYDTAQAIFRAMLKNNVGPVIFEIARSEISYTAQEPHEYICAITAAAIKVGYAGPLFIQGDHFQINAEKFSANRDKEIQEVKDLIRKAIDAGFYNIDLDTSTLVDLSKSTLKEQQELNYTLASNLTKFIRELEPTGVTISIGGEIGEVGGKNSTASELQAFMDGYLEKLSANGENLKGISKISVQTGTAHGGVPLADGTIAEVSLDFDTLEKISGVAKDQYGLAGAVQHGASTLPDEAFDKFHVIGTAEIHLATGFQNMVYDSTHFPADLRHQIYEYIKTNFGKEKKETDTEEQFMYKTRKKGIGPFKKELWSLSEKTRNIIGLELENQFSFLFKQLNVKDTKDVVEKYI